MQKLIKIYPEWNVNAFMKQHKVKLSEIKIQPEWNVNVVSLTFIAESLIIKIQPEWNVNLNTPLEILSNYYN
ncbi:hypothetical protein HMPREF0391_10926 [Finegoldia magna ATCC 53516]|uniref:Uncharacterized protein n=1 Tax=Finegoldia magna ATCC 53516 TaxID=525282 RepID=D6S8Z0_FINMA|nr:hypothetical protein HMPREF0391_10926 [Finegoldia magna ATCC 53516]